MACIDWRSKPSLASQVRFTIVLVTNTGLKVEVVLVLVLANKPTALSQCMFSLDGRQRIMLAFVLAGRSKEEKNYHTSWVCAYKMSYCLRFTFFFYAPILLRKGTIAPTWSASAPAEIYNDWTKEKTKGRRKGCDERLEVQLTFSKYQLIRQHFRLWVLSWHCFSWEADASKVDGGVQIGDGIYRFIILFAYLALFRPLGKYEERAWCTAVF